MVEPSWRRRLARVLWDCSSWVGATVLVVITRYDFGLMAVLYRSLAIYIVAACVLQVVVGAAMKLYRGRYRTASFDEIFGLGLTVAVVSVLLSVVALGILGSDVFPRATAVLVPPIALMFMAGARWAYRARQG